MSDPLTAALQQACDRFSSQAGQISILLEDKQDRFRIAIDETTKIPSASVIKPAIACAAFHDLNLKLDQFIDLRELDETRYCSIMKAFEPADTLTLKELIGVMLIVSDNPATTLVLDYVGIDKVRDWLNWVGMDDTNFDVGFTDFDLDGRIRTNLTTAEDCLTLLKQIGNPRGPYGFIRDMMENNLRNERIPKRLPDDAVIVHKTGTLNGLVHDIAIIESPVVSYYLVVLADQLPDTHKFAYDLAVFSEQIYEMMHQSTPR
ncbi:MAG: serine hydrolase [Pseudomonadota bacterium]